MDLKAAVQILDRWVTVNMKQHAGKKPGVSFIISTILKYPTTRHIAEEFGGYGFLRIAYIIFELHEGSTYEEALAKTEIIYFVELEKYDDIGYIDEGCEECGGSGNIDCDECNNTGTIECHTCEGAGEIENGDESEDCSVCDGSGQETCNECYGEGETECYNCDGSGKSESNEKYFRVTKTVWTFLSNEIYEKIRDIEEMNDDDKYISEDDFLDNVFGEGKDLFLLRSHYDSDDITHDDAPTDISDEDSVVGRYGDIKHETRLVPVIIGDRLRA